MKEDHLDVAQILTLFFHALYKILKKEISALGLENPKRGSIYMVSCTRNNPPYWGNFIRALIWKRSVPASRVKVDPPWLFIKLFNIQILRYPSSFEFPSFNLSVWALLCFFAFVMWSCALYLKVRKYVTLGEPWVVPGRRVILPFQT